MKKRIRLVGAGWSKGDMAQEYGKKAGDVIEVDLHFMNGYSFEYQQHEWPVDTRNNSVFEIEILPDEEKEFEFQAGDIVLDPRFKEPFELFTREGRYPLRGPHRAYTKQGRSHVDDDNPILTLVNRPKKKVKIEAWATISKDGSYTVWAKKKSAESYLRACSKEESIKLIGSIEVEVEE